MIVESAIRQSGKVYRGRRHHNIIADMVQTHHLPIPIMGEQGFVTDKGIFMDRETAADHALLCGQIKKPTKRLYSEDLY
jgi:hypothetical protein